MLPQLSSRHAPPVHAGRPRRAAGRPAEPPGSALCRESRLTPHAALGAAGAATAPAPAGRRPLARQILSALLVLVAAVPVAYIASLALGASRNIVFWDEFDTALDLILRLDAGADITEIVRRLFAINNEHRILTSRLLFAASYWLTGTINFHIVGAVGNLCIVGACARLLATAATWPRRLRLGVILALVIFQLENFECFLWSGASIDHFQVVMYAAAAIAAVAHGSRPALLAGGLFAALANFTLAHGSLVWPVGALLLARDRRWRHLLGWSSLALVVLAVFFHDFRINPSHHLGGFDPAALLRVGHYWLTLLGGPPALGSAAPAPFLGALLLAGLAGLGATGAARREPVYFFVALFAVGSLGLVAFGRTGVSGGQILSRYMILGTLAWALVTFMSVERFAGAGGPARLLLWLLPGLILFNLAADLKFLPLAEGYAEARDRAASRFLQYGDDTHGAVRLHPQEGHARALLAQAASQGVYALPTLCEQRSFPEARPSNRMVAQVDETTVGARSVYLGGWAMLPDERSRRGQIHVVLRSAQRELMFSTIAIQRPDVARAYAEPRWRLCGFRFVVARHQLPREDFQIGLLVAQGDAAEYRMTEHWLRLADPAVAQPWISNDS